LWWSMTACDICYIWHSLNSTALREKPPLLIRRMIICKSIFHVR
jgi:hypothetical protein